MIGSRSGKGSLGHCSVGSAVGNRCNVVLAFVVRSAEAVGKLIYIFVGFGYLQESGALCPINYTEGQISYFGYQVSSG